MNFLKLSCGSRFAVEVIATDMYGTAFPLTEKEGNADECEISYTYSNDNVDVALTLSLAKDTDLDTLSVDARIENKVWYDLRYHFAPYNSIVIKLTPEKRITDIFGNGYFIGKKSDCWTRPFHITDMKAIPARTMSLVWRNDKYHHMLPLCDGDFKSEILPSDGALTLSVSPYVSGLSSICCKAFVIAHGENPHDTARRAVEGGFRVLGMRAATAERTRSSKVFDYLGWCSWDSMHLDVSSNGLYEKAKEFNDKNIPVKWMLIDDGWYPENEKREAEGFEVVPEKFPEGLAACVSALKNKYGMTYVGIWECLSGGWMGLAPYCKTALERTDAIQRLNDGTYYPRIDEGGAYTYWNMRHDYLSRADIDFVKVDVECNIETMTRGTAPIGRAARNMHYALEASCGLYFDGACINCTGMGAENFWNRPVGMVNRNSEDFDPLNVKTMANFINCNVYNSYFHAYFSDTDWDMMWSDSATTKLNLVLHAVSGAAVYLSDPIGTSKRENIIPFCTDEGLLLKCDGYASPAEDRLFRDPMTENISLKAFNTAGDAGIIGVFNTLTEEREVADSFTPEDIYGIKGDKFVVYDFFKGTASILDRGESMEYTLPPYEANLYTVAPYIDGIAIIGALDKYVSPAIIAEAVKGKDATSYILHEGARFAYASEREVRVTVNGTPATPIREGILSIVDTSEIKDKVIITISS